MKSQYQLQAEVAKQNGDINRTFMEIVKDGLTKEELQTNIDRRPELWGQFSGWLETLPAKNMQTVGEVLSLGELEHQRDGYMSEKDIKDINARPIRFQGPGMYSLVNGCYIKKSIATYSRIILVEKSTHNDPPPISWKEVREQAEILVDLVYPINPIKSQELLDVIDALDANFAILTEDLENMTTLISTFQDHFELSDSIQAAADTVTNLTMELIKFMENGKHPFKDAFDDGNENWPTIHGCA